MGIFKRRINRWMMAEFGTKPSDRDSKLIKFFYRTGNALKGLKLKKSDFIEEAGKFCSAQGRTAEEMGAMFADYKRTYTKTAMSVGQYMNLGFFGMDEAERSRFCTSSLFSYVFYCNYFNPFKKRGITADKVKLATLFPEYFRRPFMAFDNRTDYKEFEAFCLTHKELFIKGRFGSGGTDARKAHTETAGDVAALFEELVGKYYIIEGLITSEETFAEFSSDAVNTLRITTVRTGDEVKIPLVFARFGDGNGVVDHVGYGSVCAAVDVESGRVLLPARDVYGFPHSVHPDSGKQIVGYQFKNWDRCIAMVRDMALRIPDLRLVGWDVAINSDGEWVLVEGNSTGALAVCQSYSGEGIAPILDEIIRRDLG